MVRPQYSRWRVLNLADLAACPDALRVLDPVAEVTHAPADHGRLLELLPAADAYFASLAVRVTAEVLARAPRLRVIATPSTGLDHLDLDAAGVRGVTILSLKDERAFLDTLTATAEMAWALLLAVVRRLPWAFEAAQRGEWARDRFRGRQLSGKTPGILGYGRLGTMVADYGRAFRMRVLAHDPRPVRPAEGVGLVDRATLLREADVLSLHVPLVPATRGLLDAAVGSVPAHRS